MHSALQNTEPRFPYKRTTHLLLVAKGIRHFRGTPISPQIVGQFLPSPLFEHDDITLLASEIEVSFPQ
jgi:hypothetical protein